MAKKKIKKRTTKKLSWTTRFFKFLAAFTASILLLMVYQNCGGGTSSGLNIGSAGGVLKISFPTGSYTMAINTNLQVSAFIEGGTGVYPSITWSSGSCISGSLSCTLNYSAAGSYTLSVYVTDSKGATATASALITVTTGGAGGSVTFTANPGNPMSGNSSGLAQTTFSWNAPSASVVNICIDSPNGSGGQLLGNSGGSNNGSASTGLWVTNNKVFYLQNTATCSGSTAANTLATFTAQVTTGGGGGAGSNCTPTSGGGIVSVAIDSSCHLRIDGWVWDASQKQDTQYNVTVEDFPGNGNNPYYNIVGNSSSAYSGNTNACISGTTYGNPGINPDIPLGGEYTSLSTNIVVKYGKHPQRSLSFTNIAVPPACVVYTGGGDGQQ